MERLLWQNCLNAKYIVGTIAFGSIILQKTYLRNRLINDDVFGHDGNGGHMLKIITNLTDEEMSRLKFVRRLAWHWKGSRKGMAGLDTISDQEM